MTISESHRQTRQCFRSLSSGLKSFHQYRKANTTPIEFFIIVKSYLDSQYKPKYGFAMIAVIITQLLFNQLRTNYLDFLRYS